jgi:predicted ATPase/DNA-binding SARP family transcriptional activator/Tfp pilus assembly protein PilF
VGNLSEGSLRLKTLGALEISIGEKPITGLASAKAKALLIYLAVTDRAHSRGALAGMFWGELPEGDARRNLRVELTKLRRAVGDCLTATRREVSFNAEIPYSLDVAEFVEQVGEIDRAAAHAGVADALSLYRGDFLADFQVRAAPAFEEWVLVERERLRQLALMGLFWLADVAGSQGDYEAGLRYAHQILGLDPWQETGHRLVMTFLARAGQRGAALAQYETCRRVLAEELGVEPEPETTALFEKIRSGDPALVSARVKPGEQQQIPPQILQHNLPAPTTSFHGRSAELDQVQKILQEPSCRLLTLLGLGGIGKTRLALELGRRLVEREGAEFPDGVFFVPLDAIEDRGGIVQAIAEVIGFRFSGRADPQDQLFAFLSNKQMVILLDNFEQLIHEAPLLTELLQAASQIKLVATSRERLNLYEEWLFALDGLSYPSLDESPQRVELAEFEAVELFVKRAQRLNFDFTLEYEGKGVRKICQILEGMPLGIELAASWTHIFSCAEIAATIERNMADLVVSPQNVPERHHSLLATFDYSWALLTTEEQNVLARLAVFRGGFDWPAAKAVAQTTRRILANLVEKSLVRRLSSGRYVVHSQVQQFSRANIPVEDREQIVDDHAAFFAGFLWDRTSNIQVSGQEDVIQEITNDLDNIRRAWAVAVERGSILWLTQMVETLFLFIYKRGLHRDGFQLFSEAIAFLERAERPLEEGQEKLLGKLLIRQGRCGEFASPNFEEPWALLERGMEISRRYEEYEDQALALLGLGVLKLFTGDYDQAQAHFDASLRIGRERQYVWIVANDLNLLAWLRIANQENERAKILCREAIDLHERLGDLNGRASALTTLGIIHSDAGEYAAAQEVYAEVLVQCQQSGHRVGAAAALTGLFVASYRQGKFDQARDFAHQSLAVNEDVGNRLGTAIAHHNLGFLAGKAGNHIDAVAHFRTTLETYQAIEADIVRVNNSRRYLADSFIAMGEWGSAREQLHRALTTITSEMAGNQILELLLSCATLFGKVDEEELAGTLLAFVQDHEAATPALEERIAALSDSLPIPAHQPTIESLEGALEAALTKLA